jgi:hypothetical protein
MIPAERLDEAREEPSSSYEPRLLDAEKSVSEATRKARTPEDKHVADVLDTYLQGLRNERNPNLSYGWETRAGVDHWEHAIFRCAVEADWYFGTTLAKKRNRDSQAGCLRAKFKTKTTLNAMLHVVGLGRRGGIGEIMVRAAGGIYDG